MKASTKKIADNRKAYHDFFIEDVFECGIVLQGTEVKSLRAGKCNLKDAYASIDNGELWLKQMHISPYEHGNIFNHEPTRPRKLLMHKREIAKLEAEVKEQGLTLIPTAAYFKGSHVKIALGLAKGKKLYDKRATSAERDSKRNIERALKDN
ncbi:MAG: SsrA-binding protein SmpB [Oscillospiraceae bacterium]|nr:SsrA-binding protein SmpB [Oscillospiraceae bacterium]